MRENRSAFLTNNWLRGCTIRSLHVEKGSKVPARGARKKCCQVTRIRGFLLGKTGKDISSTVHINFSAFSSSEGVPMVISFYPTPYKMKS